MVARTIMDAVIFWNDHVGNLYAIASGDLELVAVSQCLMLLS